MISAISPPPRCFDRPAPPNLTHNGARATRRCASSRVRVGGRSPSVRPPRPLSCSSSAPGPPPAARARGRSPARSRPISRRWRTGRRHPRRGLVVQPRRGRPPRAGSQPVRPDVDVRPPRGLLRSWPLRHPEPARPPARGVPPRAAARDVRRRPLPPPPPPALHRASAGALAPRRGRRPVPAEARRHAARTDLVRAAAGDPSGVVTAGRDARGAARRRSSALTLSALGGLRVLAALPQDLAQARAQGAQRRAPQVRVRVRGMRPRSSSASSSSRTSDARPTRAHSRAAPRRDGSISLVSVTVEAGTSMRSSCTRSGDAARCSEPVCAFTTRRPQAMAAPSGGAAAWCSGRRGRPRRAAGAAARGAARAREAKRPRRPRWRRRGVTRAREAGGTRVPALRRSRRSGRRSRWRWSAAGARLAVLGSMSPQGSSLQARARRCS